MSMLEAVILDDEDFDRIAKKTKSDSKRIKVQQRMLDEYNFENVDYIKVDVEGHELDVLQGGVKTIKRCKPLIVIEQNHITEEYEKGGKFDALEFLQSIGYEVVAYDRWTDYILKYKGEPPAVGLV